jgi:hypothetical protein
MSQYNDCKYQFLLDAGIPAGQVNEMELAWLQSITVGSIFEDLNDQWYDFLISAGIAPGQINDMQFEWLATQGYFHHTLNDRFFGFYCGIFAPGLIEEVVFAADDLPRQGYVPANTVFSWFDTDDVNEFVGQGAANTHPIYDGTLVNFDGINDYMAMINTPATYEQPLTLLFDFDLLAIPASFGSLYRSVHSVSPFEQINVRADFNSGNQWRVFAADESGAISFIATGATLATGPTKIGISFTGTELIISINGTTTNQQAFIGLFDHDGQQLMASALANSGFLNIGVKEFKFVSQAYTSGELDAWTAP